MTAVATFISKNGVAVAADSAATIVAGDSTQKVYNTSNKVFALGDNLPVCLAVWGDSEYLGMPWDILIRDFGASIKKPLNSFFDYPPKLIRFLKQNKKYFHNSRSTNVFYQELAEIYVDILDQCPKKRPLPKRALNIDLSNAISGAVEYFAEQLPHDESDANDALGERKFMASTTRCIHDIFKGIPLSSELEEALFFIAALKYLDFQRNGSGILLAGYGTKDVFPGQAIVSDSVFGTGLEIVEDLEISRDKPVVFRLLAQYNPSNTFIDGIDERLKHFYSNRMKEFCLELVNMLPDGIEAKTRAKYEKKALALLAEKEELIRGFITKNHRGPFELSLEFMPINEMADLVERMVSLTAYHSRLYEAQSTVGGPTDVVVVNKDKVFTWVKRKSDNIQPHRPFP